MAAELDAQVEAFRTRPLDAGPYTFVGPRGRTSTPKALARASTTSLDIQAPDRHNRLNSGLPSRPNTNRALDKYGSPGPNDLASQRLDYAYYGVRTLQLL